MFAIIELEGTQYRVAPSSILYVNRMNSEVGQIVDIPQVLLLNKDKEIEIGRPYVEKTIVRARVLEHLKGDKVLVFHKKRRKGYKKLNGHRQYLTKLEIISFLQNEKEIVVETTKKNSTRKSEESSSTE
ncbi:MAG: 50S ribosomal protein L21 [Bacteroidales bacterium]|nr:50S ribosomal protein L21 [Bacteroidales bacterium]